MIPRVTFDRSEETPEAKARWFQSLTIDQRIDVFCAFFDLMVSANPNWTTMKNVQQPSSRVLVLSRTQR
jgi:hypothetical protein